MSPSKCTTVIAGILEDRTFNHICFIAESLSTLLPNFYYKCIYKSSSEWEVYDVKLQQRKCLCTPEECHQITIIGAGTSVCPDLVCQLLMTKELWWTHGIIINLYDEPGCFFKLKKIHRDARAVGSGLNRVTVLDNVPDGLKDCNILIYLDSFLREEHEGTDELLQRNYKYIEGLCIQINEYAPPSMKVIFCSPGFTCFYVNIVHKLVTKLPSTNIVAVSSHYGLELIYPLVHSLGYTLKNFGCPPVWGYLGLFLHYSTIGINYFVDVDRMIQKVQTPQHAELRWFFYMSHNKKPYKENLKRKALAQYQLGRSEDFQKCRAICDLLKLWYSKKENIGDEIISLGIASDGSFGIPKGLVFSQPVHLKVLEDNSRIWIPFKDFPMPNMPISIFRSFIDTAIIINEKITELIQNSKFKEKFPEII
nr:PREDICTED: putative malate dehydrogenase 1B [Megachile rotundata]